MNVMTSPPPVGERKVDANRGNTNGDVSAQWFRRGPDERFLTLEDLMASVSARRDSSFEETSPVKTIRFDASRDDESKLLIMTPDGRQVAPTHYSFGQICSLVKAPAPYLRGMHAYRAALNLQADVLNRGDLLPMKIYGETDSGTLRAMTGPDYGRIYDADIVGLVQKIADPSRWKVPGMMDWAKGTYNPYVNVSSETTTLYASDRDVFVFLVDDTHPIEIGKLPNGDPDYIFRGFYIANSEVGARSLTLATFWLRGVCQNRNLWGIENFEKLRIVHSKHGNLRFEREMQPALEAYAASEPTALLSGIAAAKGAKAAEDDEGRKKVLVTDLGFSMKFAETVIETHEREEQKPMESVWDFVMGISAVARTVEHQDKRLEIETVASKLMSRATRGQI